MAQDGGTKERRAECAALDGGCCGCAENCGGAAQEGDVFWMSVFAMANSCAIAECLCAAPDEICERMHDLQSL